MDIAAAASTGYSYRGPSKIYRREGPIKKIFLAVIAAASLAYAKFFGGPMDGTSWDVKVSPESLFSFSQRGTLVFENGMLSLSGRLASGFTPALYLSKDGRGLADQAWNASLSSAQDGIINWQGFVRGDRIEGIAVWWTKNGKPKRFSFKGRRKTA
ncbi:MAG: hypothetical protein A3J74_04995 [Elusimicrobia bacterium RIFCSPHIGHO2_02_FULL_57_9]|nr:MAG: hypothetical protein A3J74_04995 [Elusimicrobia bacterium RIFCSPHIGHO2_02_FULL_57_9]